MRDEKRIKRILKLLERLWNIPQNRDMRLGQLLENYIFQGRPPRLWYQEDDDTEKLLKAYFEVK